MLDQQVRDLCSSFYQQLVQLKDDPDESMMDLDEVQQLDPVEALEHTAEAVKELINLKRSALLMEDMEKVDEKKFSKILSQLEGEVRDHIKVEHQLKLYIDHTQGKIDAFEKEQKNKKKSYDKQAQLLEKQRQQLVSRWNKLKQSKMPNQEINELQEVANDLRESITKVNLQIQEVQTLIIKQQCENDIKSKFPNSIYKLKYEQECLKVHQLRRKLKSIRPAQISRDKKSRPITLARKVMKRSASQVSRSRPQSSRRRKNNV